MTFQNKVKIFKKLRNCPGKLHSWVDSNVGIIRKENKNIPSYLLNNFKQKQIKKRPKLKWYQKLLFFLKNIINSFRKRS